MGEFLRMTADQPGRSEAGRDLKVGDTVRYVATVSGGMLKVEFEDGSIQIVHPSCFPQTR